MKSFNLHLYAVTADGTDINFLEKQVEQAILGGVTFVQLREKSIGFETYVLKGKRIKAVCEKYGVPFVINDDVEVAKAAFADGVHIGQSDMELKRARGILGHDKIIGVSASNADEAIEAQRGGADYIGAGAVFSTGSKTDAKVIGTGVLKEIKNAVSIPVVAIGGVNLETMEQIAKTGVDGIAVISALFGQKNIKQAAKELYNWRQNLKA